MKIAIMQPYFFPYIGYFQLIKSADTFVVYDDVNYIKQGWISKNRILLNGAASPFTLILNGAGSFAKINEVNVGNNGDKLLKTITHAYGKAPYFKQVFPIIENILMQEEKNLAKYLAHSLIKISSYLELPTKIIISSAIEKNNDLKGQDKVIEICKKLNAKEYINAIGGTELYSKEEFKKHDMDLKFIETSPVVYKQFNNEFVPWLSIIDLLMHNSLNEMKEHLNKYQLI